MFNRANSQNAQENNSKVGVFDGNVDVSFVVQGPIHGGRSALPELQMTRRVVESIRKNMPRAEIILSTWIGEDADWLGADRVLFSPDPGNYLASLPGFPPFYNNINRQIVGVRAGLSCATNDIAVRLRTDTLLTSPLDLSFLHRPRPEGPFALFGAPMLISSLYTRNPLKRPVLFHLSDLFHAGRLTDLRLLWDIPLFLEVESTGRKRLSHLRPDAYPGQGYSFRLAPEQYLGEVLLAKALGFRAQRSHSEWRPHLVIPWLQLLATNFVIRDPSNIGITFINRIQKDSNAYDIISESDELWLRRFTIQNPSVSDSFKTILCYSLKSIESRPVFGKVISVCRRILNK